MTRLQQGQELLDRQARLPDHRPKRADGQFPVHGHENDPARLHFAA